MTYAIRHALEVLGDQGYDEEIRSAALAELDDLEAEKAALLGRLNEAERRDAVECPRCGSKTTEEDLTYSGCLACQLEVMECFRDEAVARAERAEEALRRTPRYDLTTDTWERTDPAARRACPFGDECSGCDASGYCDKGRSLARAVLGVPADRPEPEKQDGGSVLGDAAGSTAPTEKTP